MCALRDEVAASLDARLRELADGGFSGVARITRAGVTEFEACHGMANRADSVPIHAGTRFGLASVTKMFTAVAIASLVRDGALEFDARVVDILPPERRPSTLRADVTVHHLLTHTAGIADYAEEEGEEELDYAEIWQTRPSYRMLRPADFLQLFGDLPPYREPGLRLQYSNAGYVLLGLVIEEAASQPYIDVVTERVFTPAGMTASGFFALDEVHPDVATGYVSPSEPDGPWRSNIYSIPIVGGADGGALSTAGDLDRFLTAYDAGTLVGPEMRDVMLTPRATVEGEDDLTMGYGVFLRGEGPDRRFGHGGGDPGVEATIQRLPEWDANIVVLCNMTDMTYEVRELLINAVITSV